ncbi:MAG: DUF3011 domain-containing protein [Steroidobacteraceae bacterium]|nr:DUF3011 domain-containing protein [Steroidobacteraceae bacterium]MBP7014474.1 DUF3011 domain-containing protein [Steroidobacteraceae bacterium]
MRSIARLFLAALLAMAASVPASGWAQAGVAPAVRAPVNQPALKQAPAPQTRSAQGDCVREANRRGYTVLDTSNFQQLHDGWSIDLRVRNQRGQVTNGSCFVETRTGDVNLYGFGWGYDDDGDDRTQFNCASVEKKYRECQLPVNGRAVLVKRLSDARCVEGQSWGQRGDRVWVAHGCRARFEVTRGGRILQQNAAVAMPGGCRMQLRVRMPKGETRNVSCTYSSQSGQVRLDLLSGT